ncbi:MAG: anti-sigma factor [Erythrobacter sp.]|nr:anti-sigma factor [Erythrobacter sp.]
MTITPEEIAAFADGQMEGDAKARVAAAVAADPQLARQVEAHRALAARLAGHFAPILDQPVPEALAGLLQKAGEGGQEDRAEVIDLAAARSRRDLMRRLPGWGGAAIAAALVAALVFSVDGGNAPGDYADARLASALDRQLVASQPIGAETRILLSFRNEAGEFCRAYSQEGSGGIACRDSEGWRQHSLGAGGQPGEAEFRMAGSEGEILEAAQEMAAGPALSATQEVAARSTGWR